MRSERPTLAILLVEDDERDARRTVQMFHQITPDPTGLPQIELRRCYRLEEAVAACKRDTPDLILLEPDLPDAIGLDAMDRLRTAAPHVPLLVLTRQPDDTLRFVALRHGAEGYLTKTGVDAGLLGIALREALGRAETRRELAAARDREQVQIERVSRLMWGNILCLAKVVEVRDPYTAGHQARVAHLAVEIARELGLRPDRIETVEMAALVHDVGKVAVPVDLLSKPGRLTPMELELIRHHAQVGQDIVAFSELPEQVAEAVGQHHERLDGTGYPCKLSGDQVCEGARIVGVSDVFEAMMSHRPYRPALGVATARRELVAGRGRGYDPAVVDACLAVLERAVAEGASDPWESVGKATRSDTVGRT